MERALHSPKLDPVNLGEVINRSVSALLHSPSLSSTVSTLFNSFRDRPNPSTLSHVETTHWLFISGKLISIENPPRADKTRVSVLIQPFLPNLRARPVQHSLRGNLRLLNSLHLLHLPRLVIRRGGETKRFPNRGYLGRTQIGLSNERKIEFNSGKIVHAANFVSFLLCAVETVSKSVLVQAVFEANFGDDLLTLPKGTVV
mmetsp:Transcript_9098/g.11206  ORF Transcript_9098/g.11206 Transcript_9098/m.11206 type:complete len:201 (-) Transcript_9098:291-893(-)